VSFVVIKLNPDQTHLHRHLIPGPPLEHAASLLLVRPPPLLEEKWHPGPQTLIAEFHHPDSLGRVPSPDSPSIFDRYNKGMNLSVTHDRQEETIEAKTLWFRSLALAERMDMLCAFTELLLLTNPKIVEQRDAEPAEGRVLVLTTA
jgi:hypothetical protein